MAEAKKHKCKYCGRDDFPNRGYLTAHYKTCEAKRAEMIKVDKPENLEKEKDIFDDNIMEDRDPASVMKPVYDKKAEPSQPLDVSIEKQITQMGRATAEELRKYPRFKILIPEDPLNKKAGKVVVGINGATIAIDRGKPVELPEPVIDLLEEGGYRPTYVR